MTKEPFFECPRYKACSVNNCPLDPMYPLRVTDEGDVEQKCNIAKNLRIRISNKYPGLLKFEGLTPREFSARKNWENLSEEEKEKKRETAKKARLQINSGFNSGSQNIPQNLEMKA